MTITAAEILSEVQTRVGDTSIADVDDEIAFILEDFGNHYQFLQTSSTIAVTTQATALPSSFRNMRAAADTNGGEIDLVELKEVLARERLDGSAGGIERVAIWGSNAYVHPIPAASETITLFYGEDSTTIGDWPDHFKLALIHGVTWQVYDRKGLSGEAPKAVAAKAAYDQRLMALINRYKERDGVKHDPD